MSVSTDRGAAASPMSDARAERRAVVPPAGPRLRKRERAQRGLIAAGVVLVLACGLGAGLLFEHQGGKVSVIKVAKAVPAGHVITAVDLTTAQMASDDIPAFAGDHMSEVVGKVAAVGLVPGEIVNRAMVTTRSATPNGYVVAGVSLKPGQLPAAGVSAGDHVMVIVLPSQTAAGASSAKPGASGSSATVLENSVQVSGSAVSPDGTNTLVSLLIPQADAPALVQANNAGLVALTQVPSP